MLMATLVNPAIPCSPCLRYSIPATTNVKFLRVSVPAQCCLKKYGGINGFSPTHSPKNPGDQDDGDIPMKQSFKGELQSEIWRLFKASQRNIVYLNQQRIMAVEKLNKVNREKQLLVEKIEQLEKENRRTSWHNDNLAICWKVLLRIDSMVLGGIVSSAEASDLRRMVMDRKVSLADIFPDMLHKRDVELLAELRHFSERSKSKGFHIIHICTEMEPLVSSGPLGSYITGLSRALQRKGHLVEVILPKYASLDLPKVEGLREIEAESYSYFDGQLRGNKIWTGVVCGIGVTFIQPVHFSTFFSRDKIYGYPDDFERFSYFSRASLDYIAKSGKQPDVLHVHNWEAAIVGPLFWDIFAKQGLGNTRILLTCHGFDSQCLVEPDKLALCGLDPGTLHRLDRLQDDAKMHFVNILKGGVVYSNKVVVMSSMHSKEGIIRSMSHGLDHTLALYKEKLSVAPCGFDNATWDPSKDKFLPLRYSVENMRGKDACKVLLKQKAGLYERASSILVGCIFSEISDFELENLKAIVWNATKRGAQFIFMGNGEGPSVNRVLESFKAEVEDGNAKLFYGGDEALSHLMFAGCDIMLCWSYHDPVLQVPLKALKYGAAPILVTPGNENFRYSTDHDHEITRLSQFIRTTFRNMSLDQALDEINNNPSTWKRKIANAMEQDFSWDAECCDVHVSAYNMVKSL